MSSFTSATVSVRSRMPILGSFYLKLLFLSVLLLGFDLAGCRESGGEKEGGGAPPRLEDTSTPAVSSMHPAPGADSVAIDSSLSVIFSEEIDPSSLTTETFLLKSGEAPVAGTVTLQENSATFDPLTDLRPGQVYTATLTTGVRDRGGNHLDRNFSWQFKTGGAIDTAPPVILTLFPDQGASDVPTNRGVTVTFSEAVDPMTVTPETFFVGLSAEPHSGEVHRSGATATWTPSIHLAPHTTYTATLTTGVKDLSGNPLERDRSWTFTTGADLDATSPAVLSTVPQDGQNRVSVEASISATFSERIDPSSITSAGFILTSEGKTIPGTVTQSGTTATFRPSALLDFNTSFTATITTSAKDLAGNPMASDYRWQFTTVSAESPPSLSVLPASLQFTAEAGAALPAAQKLTLSNNGGGVLNWSASSELPWLHLTPASGATPSLLTVSTTTTRLAPGTHRGAIILTAPGAPESPVTIPVNYTVVDSSTCPGRTRAPYVAFMTSTTATLAWECAPHGKVEWGVAPDLSASVLSEGIGGGNKHFATLSNLRPNTRYAYRVTVNEKLLGEATFQTAKGKGDNHFTFIAFGDSGKGTPEQFALAALMKKLRFSFALLPGDIVYDTGLDADYDPKYFTPYKKLIPTLPFFAVAGNHDLVADNGTTFMSNFFHPAGKRYYDFHWGETHFIALDSNYETFGAGEAETQRAWLDRVLAASGARWKVVFFHHPPYNSGATGEDQNARRDFVPLFEKYAVDLVLTGHAHSYERMKPINGVTYVVTGGGGAGLSGLVDRKEQSAYFESVHHLILAEMTADRLTLKAMKADGTVFDSVVLSKGGGTEKMWASAAVIDGPARYSHPVPFQLDNGDLIVGYTTSEGTGNFDFKLVRSRDGGESFSASTRVTVADDAQSIFEGSFAQLNDSSRTLVAVYGAGTSVMMKRSTDLGATWGEGVPLETGTGSDPHPDVSRLSNGDLFLVYYDDGDIVGRRSGDGGTTWSGKILISDQADILKDPSVAQTANGDLLVSFMTTGPFRGVQTVRSTDQGATWTGPADVREEVGAPSVNDANLLVLSSGRILLSYSVGSNQTGPPPAFGTRGLYLLTSDDHGFTWRDETLVYDQGDPHRGNFAQLANGDLIGMCALIEGDTDYHISRLTPPPTTG